MGNNYMYASIEIICSFIYGYPIDINTWVGPVKEVKPKHLQMGFCVCIGKFKLQGFLQFLQPVASITK